MVKTKYITTQVIKIQEIEGKTKLRFHENISDYYDEMKYRQQNVSFFTLKKIFL